MDLRPSSYPVFRKGKWITYTPRETIASDPRFTTKLCYTAAAVYATAIFKGQAEENAHNIAEAIVFKKIYDGLEYNKDFEETLKIARE